MDSDDARPEDSGLPGVLAGELDAFVFFHLGSDAEVTVTVAGDRLLVSVQHRRVFPIRFDLVPGMVDEFSRHPESFEEFLLDQLTRHRRDA